MAQPQIKADVTEARLATMVLPECRGWSRLARAAALGAIVALFGGLQAAQANGHLLQPNFSASLS